MKETPDTEVEGEAAKELAAASSRRCIFSGKFSTGPSTVDAGSRASASAVSDSRVENRLRYASVSGGPRIVATTLFPCSY